jgi:hypothetical protein
VQGDIVTDREDPGDLPCLPINVRFTPRRPVSAMGFALLDPGRFDPWWGGAGYSFLKFQNFLRDREVSLVPANKDISRMREQGKALDANHDKQFNRFPVIVSGGMHQRAEGAD